MNIKVEPKKATKTENDMFEIGSHIDIITATREDDPIKEQKRIKALQRIAALVEQLNSAVESAHIGIY
jgi:hypothetical protein